MAWFGRAREVQARDSVRQHVAFVDRHGVRGLGRRQARRGEARWTSVIVHGGVSSV